MGELLYIRSTGTQYIDTGFAPDQLTRVVCRAIVPNTSGTNWLFGARQSSSAKLFTFAFSTNGHFVAGYGSETQSFDKACNTEKEMTVDMGYEVFDGLAEQHCWIETEHGREYKSAGTDAGFTCPCPLTLFAGNTNGSITCGKVTIFSFDIYAGESETIAMRLIPWKHGDGRIGMMNTLTGSFYPNAGEGEFEYEEKPEQGGDISFAEFIANPKHRWFPFQGIVGWKMYNSSFGGGATQTVTFDTDRFLDEPDAIFPPVFIENMGMWFVSDYIPAVYDLLSADCKVRLGSDKYDGYLDILSVKDYGIFARIICGTIDASNTLGLGQICVVNAPFPGVMERAGMYFVYTYPQDDALREQIAATDASITITFSAV